MGCACSRNITKYEDIRDFYKIGRLLGTGAFAQVRECMENATRTIRAVKIMEKKLNEKGQWSYENMFRKEAYLLKLIEHENIIKCYNIYEDKHFLYAVIDRCEGGELFEQILQRKQFTEEAAAVICRQILEALNYIHHLNIVHRDIKAENFLFKDKTSDSLLILIDFGMSARIFGNQMLNEVCGSPHYLAPELIKRHYNSKADMWALGVLIYLMIYGKYPFDGTNTNSIVKNILTKQLEWRWNHFEPSEMAIDFMDKLLERNPNKRFPAYQALMHPWVAEKSTEKKEKNIPMDFVRAAHTKIEMHKNLPTKEVDERRNMLLKKLNEEFEKSMRKGSYLSVFHSKKKRPEFLRRDKRISTTPSRFDGIVSTNCEEKYKCNTMDSNEKIQIDFIYERADRRARTEISNLKVN